MTNVTLPNNYYITIDRIRNYILYKKETHYNKKKGCDIEVNVMLGYYSSFESAIQQGYMKDMEATEIKPSTLTVLEYLHALEDIENKAVSDFKRVLSVQLNKEELDEVLGDE